MAVINYAEAYAKALYAEYAHSMYFGDLFTSPNNEVYRPIDAKTIKIPTIETTGRVEGSRDTIGSFKRNVNNDWETKTLGNHRAWETLIHPQDVAQTGGIMAIVNATKYFNEYKKLPEKQAYLVSKIYADWTTAGGVASTTALTTANVLTYIDTVMESMDEARVPVEGRILYCTPSVKTMLKQAMTRYIANGDKEISRTVNRVDELKIISVPTDLMKTVYDFSEGYEVGAGAKQINAFFVHPSAVLTPENYAFASMEEPSVMTKGKYAYYEEAFEDVFILNKRKGAIAFNVKSTEA